MHVTMHQLVEVASHFSQAILTITYLLFHMNCLLKDVHFVCNWEEPVCMQLYTWPSYVPPTLLPVLQLGLGSKVLLSPSVDYQ